MDKQELIKALNEVNGSDEEEDHIIADELLLKYIDDEEISKAFHDIKKWYA